MTDTAWTCWERLPLIANSEEPFLSSKSYNHGAAAPALSDTGGLVQRERSLPRRFKQTYTRWVCTLRSKT